MPHPLQDAFDKVVDQLLSTDALFTEYLVRKLVQAGHTITEAQRAAIQQQLQGEVLNDEIQIEGIEGEPVVLTQTDYEELRGIEQRLLNELDDLYQTTVNDAATTTLAELRTDLPAVLAQHKRRRLRFERELASTWEEALQLLELLLILATDMGDRVNEDLRSSAATANDLVFEVAARLHARACQISNEILTLLKAGYADGAMARWRSLHELVVIVYFVIEKGQPVAERYVDHYAVARYRGAQVLAAHQATSGLTPLTDAEHTSIEESYNKVIARYGQHFTRDYGWAAPVKNNYNPRFSDLEGELEFKQLVPYTKMAHHNVHAGAMRLYSSLGTNGLDDDCLLTGPSDLGLCIPIQLTANSITQLTIAFLSLKDTLDNHYRDRMLLDLATITSQVSVKAAAQAKAE